jgi:hypothetical protein
LYKVIAAQDDVRTSIVEQQVLWRWHNSGAEKKGAVAVAAGPAS